MGKRKSSSKPQGPKKADPLPTTFTCLFCNHEKSISVKLDKKLGIGYLECKVCGQTFQCAINYLSAAVDVYGEWVDAADSVAKEKVESENSRGRLDSGRYPSGRAGASSRDLDEDDDGGQRRYADDEDDY
ncbi:MAG: hypothetical protein STHCBS139747_002838 [Sporothrix thermara]